MFYSSYGDGFLKKINPVGKIVAKIECPASKSYTNRALLIAALANGVSTLQKPLISNDTKYMRLALEQFGVFVKQEGHDFIVSGTGGNIKCPQGEISIGLAGTTMRFLTTFAALSPGTTHLTGERRMLERPISDLLNALNQMGVKARSLKNNGCPPLEIPGGGVSGGKINLAGDKSSQYLTSILLCAPYFKSDTTINIIGTLTSKSYADITLSIMEDFGVTVQNKNYTQFYVPAGQTYQAKNYAVEADWSSASYFLAAAAITQGEMTLFGLKSDSLQGDAGFLDVLEQMGCTIERSPEKIFIKGNPLRGIDINMNNMPDVAQTLAVTALFAKGETRISGIGNLKIKETDRIEALKGELSRLGARVETGEDFLTVHPGTYVPADIETYDDHRMAMSLALAGLKIPGVRIKNPNCVEKSFPDFFERLESIL
jgi:3-phosphoshikimate 1-carboxyvinyltransferase